MSDLEFRAEPRVRLLRWMGDDMVIAESARVSTGKGNGQTFRPEEYKANAGLVRRLIVDRHGTPVEHVVFTHEIETSIMVARESHRHRMASISEASLRYMEGQPVVYVPGPERHLVQASGTKQMDYVTEPGDAVQRSTVDVMFLSTCQYAWDAYRQMLDAGILREVARGVLPLCFGTRWHLTWNLRSIFNYLSLRINDPAADRPSHPQYEIEQVARLIEATVAEKVPVAYTTFIDNGRRVP